MAITWIRRSISFLIRVSGRLIVVVDLAIVPKNVKSPVAKTRAVAVPFVKLHPHLARFLASVINVWPASVPNFISTFSPVKDALFTLRSLDCKILKSAGTFSPNYTLTISPITNDDTSTYSSFPFLCA